MRVLDTSWEARWATSLAKLTTETTVTATIDEALIAFRKKFGKLWWFYDCRRTSHFAWGTKERGYVNKDAINVYVKPGMRNEDMLSTPGRFMGYRVILVRCKHENRK